MCQLLSAATVINLINSLLEDAESNFEVQETFSSNDDDDDEGD
jgi:hypothetical protein